MASTAIRRFSYDDQSATLFVTFTDGDLYAYRDVPKPVHIAFGAAPSKGRFFAKAIRDTYRYVKMPRTVSGSGQAIPARRPGGRAWPPPAGAGR